MVLPHLLAFVPLVGEGRLGRLPCTRVDREGLPNLCRPADERSGLRQVPGLHLGGAVRGLRDRCVAVLSSRHCDIELDAQIHWGQEVAPVSCTFDGDPGPGVREGVLGPPFPLVIVRHTRRPVASGRGQGLADPAGTGDLRRSAVNRAGYDELGRLGRLRRGGVAGLRAGHRDGDGMPDVGRCHLILRPSCSTDWRAVAVPLVLD